ncbi:MAG: class I SAM-dependent methyltransferase [Ignavibacteria bacterium]|nr:class I SAM-dependent methyltransferase [Ignavibacteria bacterium]
MNFIKYFKGTFMLFMLLYTNSSLAVGSSDDEIESANIIIKQKGPHKKEKFLKKEQEPLPPEDEVNDSYEKKLSYLNAQLSTLTTQIADYLVKINENNARLAKHGLPTTAIPCFQGIDNLKSLAQTAKTDDWQNPVVVNTLSYLHFYNDITENFVLYRELRNLHSESMPIGDVKIIDAGGGTGLLAKHLKAEDSRREVEIFDLSEPMTKVAIEKGMSPANIHISTITNLIRSNGTHVPDNSIDGIMTNQVLYQLSLEEVNQFFTEAYRVLKKKWETLCCKHENGEYKKNG